MALTLLGRTAGKLGAGYVLTVHTDVAGPIPFGDWAYVTLQKAGGSFALDSGSALAAGSRTVGVYVGISYRGGGGAVGVDINQGDAIDVEVTWLHDNNTVVDGPTVFHGFVFDSITGTYAIAEYIAAQGFQAQLDAIKAAVSKTFPATS